MASLDDLLRQLGIGGVTRNRAGQIVTNTNDVVPVATAGLADTLYGAGRGTLAGTAAIGGIPGDINQMYVNKFGALFPNQPAPPTSEQISTAVKRAVPPLNLSRDNTGSVATSLGENVVAPITAPESLLGAARATKGMPVGMSIQDVSKTTNPVKGLIEQSSPIVREGNPIQSAVVLIGDKIFTGRTHSDALQRAIFEGEVRKEGGKLIFPKNAEVNSDLFMTHDGKIIDRYDAYKLFDIGASETAIKEGLMQNKPASSMSVDSYMKEAKKLKNKQ